MVAGDRHLSATQLPVGVKKQDYQDSNWHIALNAGFDDLNTRLTLSGTTSPEGVVTGRWKGQRYFQTDVVAWWVFNGTLDTNTGWVRETPQGVVQMWSGSVGSIPSGWALCDGSVVGSYTTPNLKGRFIVGYDAADADYNAIGDTGGEKQHTLTESELPAHNHGGATGSSVGVIDLLTLKDANTASITLSARAGDPAGNTLGSPDLPSHTHLISSAGSGTAHENRPPFYTLAFIVKL